MTDLDNKFCVYAHYTSDTNELFYIGKGTEFRAKQFGKTNRNDYWNKVANKHGVRVKILSKNLSEQEAFSYEKEMICAHSPRCNLTDGGDGPSGAIRSPETRRKIGLASKKRVRTTETKMKTSEALKKAYSEGRRKSTSGFSRTKEQRDNIAMGQGMRPFKVYKNDKLLGTWTNAAECARDLGINRNSAWVCATGKQQTCKGYRFERSN